MKKRIKNLHSLLTWRFDTPWPLLLRGSFVKDFLFFEKKSWWRLSFFFKNRCLLSFSTSASSNSFEITGCYTIKNWIWKKNVQFTKGNERVSVRWIRIFFFDDVYKKVRQSVDARLLIFLYCVVVFNLTFCLLCWRCGFCMVGVQG